MDARSMNGGGCSGTALLLAHLAAIGAEPTEPPARERLEAALGPELARKLVYALGGRSGTGHVRLRAA